MPDEYDAFGRKIGEDSLADVGWSSGAATPQAPFPQVPQSPIQEPVPAPFAPPPAQASAPPVAPPSGLAPPPVQPMAPPVMQMGSPPPVMQVPVTTSSRRSGGGFAGVLIALIIVGGIGFAIWKITSGVEHTVKEATKAIPTISLPSGVPTAQAPEKPLQPASGINGASLVAAKNFGAAMKAFQSAKLGKLQHLRLAPDRIDAQFVTNDGRIRNAEVSPGGVPQVLSTSGPGFSASDTLSIAAINAGAPAHLVRAAAPHVKKKPGDIDYLVYMKFGDQLQWIAYYKGGRYAFGDTSGNFQRAYP